MAVPFFLLLDKPFFYWVYSWPNAPMLSPPLLLSTKRVKDRSYVKGLPGPCGLYNNETNENAEYLSGSLSVFAN